MYVEVVLNYILVGCPRLNDYWVFEFWVATYGMFDYNPGGGVLPYISNIGMCRPIG